MNKKLFLVSIFTFVLMLAFSTDMDAQFRKKKKKKKKKEDTEYFDESGGFKHRLWYGLNGNFNWRQISAGSEFAIGISPMVGFKIIESVSVGPRFTFNNRFIKIDYSGGAGTDIVSQNITEYGAGLFVRYKPFRQFFAHMEYEYLTTENLFAINPNSNILIERLPIRDLNDPQKFYTEKDSKDSFFVGLGYTSGSIIGYEILILYNLLNPKNNASSNPIQFRIGFTYKF